MGAEHREENIQCVPFYFYLKIPTELSEKGSISVTFNSNWGHRWRLFLFNDSFLTKWTEKIVKIALFLHDRKLRIHDRFLQCHEKCFDKIFKKFYLRDIEQSIIYIFGVYYGKKESSQRSTLKSKVTYPKPFSALFDGILWSKSLKSVF